jgi:hypothetical protein
MNYHKFLQQIVTVGFVLVFFVGCSTFSTPAAISTPSPFTSTPILPTAVPMTTTLPTFTPPPQKDCKALGDREVVVSKSDRDRLNLKWWPDGVMGVLSNNTGYIFFAANGGKIAQTAGTLDNPISGISQPILVIKNMKNEYQYSAGGPIYRDFTTGNLLMFYHAEKWPNGTEYKRFYSLLGMAKSTDGGNTWNDLGEIVTPEIRFGENYLPVEVEGAPFIVKGDYFYVYFSDYLASGRHNNLAVARAKVQDVVKAASESNGVVPWFKFYEGTWSEPGLGGRSSALENGNPEIRWFDVSLNEYLGKYLMAVSARNLNNNNINLYLVESTDGLVWDNRKPIAGEPGESFYTTIVSTGSESRISGQQFYIYYTFSGIGEFDRWKDAVLARRLITCSN